MDLMAVLEELGIEKLREGPKEISGRCPAHKRITGRSDSRPSWSINKETGAHICYSCQWRGGLVDLFQEVRGSVPDDLVHDLQVTSISRSIARATEEPEPEVEPDWDWAHEVSVSVPVPESLREHRHLGPDALAHYQVMWNRERAAWMLPYTHPDGTVYGAQYRVKGAEMNMPEGVEAKASLFGIDKVLEESGPVALVESPLDAVRLWQVGAPAVASFGVWVSAAQVDILSRHFDLVVIAMDCDKAGLEANDRLHQVFSRKGLPHLFFEYATADPTSEEYRKDPGDYIDDKELLSQWNQSFRLFAPTK